MKKLAIFLIFLLAFVDCAIKGGKSFSDLGEPDAFCELVQKPDPLLMGTWEGRFTRTTKELDRNYVKYRLIEYDGKYALYFYRTGHSGKRIAEEWKKWAINGQEISGTGGYGVKIFIQGGNVYFSMRGVKQPARMSRVEE
ncbi:MAG: hypothetical protein JSU72_15800 [Deltaproteobacteria bacterium]|nr:MAG: hypothetical protein JSU72_15800 [Deltaproteobacteria bacterium]